MSIAFNASVAFDSPDYTFNGEPVAAVSVGVPRVRYIEKTRPQFREQRAPRYEEGKP